MDVIEAAEDIDLEELERSAGEAPVEKLCNLIMVDALRRGASEIHIEPYERSYNVRLRLDGVLYMIMNPPLRLRDAISNRFKVMAKMDIVEKRLPQRGRIRIRVNFGGKLSTHDFELHTLPTQWGEKLFLRLHDLTPKDLGELGLEEDPLAMLQGVLKGSHGFVLVCGPMGSGKTQTLYSAILSVSVPELYIATVEDQLELDLPGVTQVQIDWRIGCGMAGALRTVLAQDPDIVMADNLARPEAAAVVLEAARRHLMIGGLTAHDAIGAMSYLMNPPRGPEDSIGSNRTTPHILSGSLHLVVNQRLVRRICQECKREIEMDPEDLLQYGLTEDETRQAKTLFGKGCAACNYTGYRGRIGLFEVLKIDTEIKELLIAGASEETLRQKTGAKATWTLRQSAMQKLRDGVTTIEEVAREIRL